MTTSQLRALLDAATKRPWMVEAIDDSCPYWKVVAGCREVFDDGSACGEYDPTCTAEAGRAIVATMNAADALVALWEAVKDSDIHDGHVGTCEYMEPIKGCRCGRDGIIDALRRLEELKP